MARFNLEDYELVETRIKKFYELYPDGRIITEWANRERWDFDGNESQAPKQWVVKTTIYLDAGDQANNLAKSTGYATETDGTGGANSAGAALENCETSSIGRALANMGLSGNKRASREEMRKVERVTQQATDWLSKADKLTDVEALRQLWAQAKAGNAEAEILDRIKDRANQLSSAGSVSGGTQGGVSKLLGADVQSEATGTAGSRKNSSARS